MSDTPKGSKLHIGIFGKRNAGKSTLMNAILGQEMSIVSPIAGTTTDVVWKSMELHPIGAVVFVDTPGLDDEGELGLLRVSKTKKALEEIDAAIWVMDGTIDKEEKNHIEALKGMKKPVLVVHNIKNKVDIKKEGSAEVIEINAVTGENIPLLKQKIVELFGTYKEKLCIGDRLHKGELVLVVAPQDIQAPKGRLILPQVQILREILDAKAIPMVTTTETLEQALGQLKALPDVAIVDSQLFGKVENLLPHEITLTSFSIAMARQKGDLEEYVKGACYVDELQENDKILIVESCTHTPLHGDIAREKIPTALEKRIGHKLKFEFIRGTDFPIDLTSYKLVIQCGGCMQTPMQIQNKINKCVTQGIKITNFGVLLAYLNGTLERAVKIYQMKF